MYMHLFFSKFGACSVRKKKEKIARNVLRDMLLLLSVYCKRSDIVLPKSSKPGPCTCLHLGIGQ